MGNTTVVKERPACGRARRGGRRSGSAPKGGGNLPPVRLRPLDVVIFLIALVVIATLGTSAYTRARGVPQAHIRGDGGLWIYPLDEDRLLHVAGPLGDTVVEIHDGTVRVLSSPCREQSCVRAGGVSTAGQWIACLPNRVFVTIEGRSPGAPDAVSR